MSAIARIDMETATPLDRRHDSLLRIEEVRGRTGLSTATIYRREAAGTFPRKVRMGPKTVGWYRTDVDAWVANPMAYRS